jgi:hypothetical protein
VEVHIGAEHSFITAGTPKGVSCISGLCYRRLDEENPKNLEKQSDMAGEL